MYSEKVNQVWFISTINGKTFLIITEHEEKWASLFDAVKKGDILYGISTTILNDGLTNLFEMVCKYDQVFFVDQKWEVSTNTSGENIDILSEYTIQFLDEDISSKDISCLAEVYSRKIKRDIVPFYFLNNKP